MRKKISNAAHTVYYRIYYQKSLSRNQIENCYYSMCTLKEVYFLYATALRIVLVTDIIHLLSVIWHTASTRTYRIISAAAQKPKPMRSRLSTTMYRRYVCTVRNRSRVIGICYIAK